MTSLIRKLILAIIVLGSFWLKPATAQSAEWIYCSDCSEAEMITIAKSYLNDANLIFVTDTEVTTHKYRVSFARVTPDGKPVVFQAPMTSVELDQKQTLEQAVSAAEDDESSVPDTIPVTEVDIDYTGHSLDSAHSVASSDFVRTALELHASDYVFSNFFTSFSTVSNTIEAATGSALSALLSDLFERTLTFQFSDGSTYKVKLKGLRKNAIDDYELVFEIVPNSGRDQGIRIPDDGEYQYLQVTTGSNFSAYFDNAVGAQTGALTGYTVNNETNEIEVCTGEIGNQTCYTIPIIDRS